MKSFWSDKRVTVTGGAGFLGQHLVKRLESFGAKVFVPRQRDYNLTALDACLKCLLEHPCDVMFHAAAYYGGIGINVAEPAKLYYTNLVMGANLMEAARLHLDQPVDVRTRGGLQGEHNFSTRSTVARELMFLNSHATHHFAILQGYARQRGETLGTGVGRAPATVAHEQRQREHASA